jgi:hypothetical protein
MPTGEKPARKPAASRKTRPELVPLRAALSSSASKLDIKRRKDGSFDLKANGPPAFILGAGAGFDLGPLFAPQMLPWSAILLGVLLAGGVAWFIHPWFEGRPAASNGLGNHVGVHRRGGTRTLRTKGLVASAFALGLVVLVHLWLWAAADLALGLAFVATLAVCVGLLLRRFRRAWAGFH